MTKSNLLKPSKAPCGSCPYRKDVPPGIWQEHEYKKLIAYDGETYEQAMNDGAFGLFMCHQNDGTLCAGWVGCHDPKHLLALRVHTVDPSTFDYKSPVPLFKSGKEAAEHGLKGVAKPGKRARRMVAKLMQRLKGRVRLT